MAKPCFLFFAFFFFYASHFTAYSENLSAKPDANSHSHSLLRMPSIASIHIVENSAILNNMRDPDVDCSGFIVTEAHVRNYFDRAEITDSPFAQPELVYAPCYAGGTLRLKDGRIVEWWINQRRRGQLIFEGGGATTVVALFCSDCHEHIYIEDQANE